MPRYRTKSYIYYGAEAEILDEGEEGITSTDIFYTEPFDCQETGILDEHGDMIFRDLVTVPFGFVGNSK